MLFAAAPVWWFWIGVAIIIPTIGLVIATVIGYVVKVVGPRYAGRSR